MNLKGMANMFTLKTDRYFSESQARQKLERSGKVKFSERKLFDKQLGFDTSYWFIDIIHPLGLKLLGCLDYLCTHRGYYHGAFPYVP